jgi:hypothetical protein
MTREVMGRGAGYDALFEQDVGRYVRGGGKSLRHRVRKLERETAQKLIR